MDKSFREHWYCGVWVINVKSNVELLVPFNSPGGYGISYMVHVEDYTSQFHVK